MPLATPADFQHLRQVKVMALRATEERVRASHEHQRALSSGFHSVADDHELENAAEWEDSMRGYARFVQFSVISMVNVSAVRNRGQHNRIARSSAGRRRGSRRCSSSTRSSTDDPGGEGEPARGWRYEHSNGPAVWMSRPVRETPVRTALRFSSPIKRADQ